jgi:hypothetical protein
LLERSPGLTIAEMPIELRWVAKVRTSPASVRRALTRRGDTRKRRFVSIERSSPTNLIRREAFAARLRGIERRRLVEADRALG